MHNGHLWFESTPGQGTTFHVALPVVQATVAEGFILEPKNRKGPVIVAIDDDQDALEVLQGYLEAAQFSVYGACNANDGLKLAHELHPVLITLDLLMPNIDGWQMLESLRRDPVTAPIPVLLVSAIDESERAKTAGANGFLRKPAPQAMLLSEVQRLVTGTGSVVENRQEADA
jgi:CheY-like chemotaxis protein